MSRILTSTPFFNSARTVAVSDFLAASTSGDPAPAALRFAAHSRNNIDQPHRTFRRMIGLLRISNYRSSVTLPVLSPKLSRLTPTFSSRVRWTFANGVGSLVLMWRAALVLRAPPPTRTMGRFEWSCMLGLPMPLPRRYSVWSSKEPSPSGVDLSFSTKYAKSDMWYALILASLASFSGLSAWCDTGWCGSGTPICGYVRVLTSRANWNVMTRVISDCRARRSEEHTSELQSLAYLVCRLLLEKKKNKDKQ